MASIASKLIARAAVACRASPAAVGGCSRLVSPCLPRRQLYLTTGRRMCSSDVTPEAEGKGFHEFPLEVSHPLSEEDKQALTVTEEKLKSDEALWAMYEYWRKHYDISRDGAELKRRFEIFKRSARFVHKTKKQFGYQYPVGLNAFADRTVEEITHPYPQCEWTEL